ncbi:hypothetical protein Tco_0675660 [Tanacetum coccineum]
MPQFDATTISNANRVLKLDKLCLNSLLEDQAELYRALSESVTLMDEIGHEAVIPTGRYVVPTGRVIATDSVIVATSGYVVPAAYDICDLRMIKVGLVAM